MAINKVNYGSETLIDISSDDVTENDVLEPVTFHKSDGTVARGNIKNNGVFATSAKSSEIPVSIPLYGFYNEGSNVLVEAIETQQKSIEISSPAVEYVFPDEGKYLESVEISPLTTEITVASGNIDEIIEGELYSKITVLAKEPIVLQDKTATPTTSEQEVTADRGAYLGKVTVKGVSITLPSADKIVAGEVASVTSNGTTLASVTGTAIIPKVASGKILVGSAADGMQFDLGFRPKMIMIENGASLDFTNVNSALIYNEDVSSTKFWRSISSEGAMYQIGLRTGASLLQVTDTGFIYRGAGSAPYIKYYAVG